MSKTLAVILHYNTPHLTDRLYEQLKPYEGGDYELVVLDNGSPDEGRSKYTNYRCDANVYFGGGLNLTMNLVLENPQYDSLLFINSDLIVHGYRLIRELRRCMFEIHNDDTPYKIISPAIIQPEKNQCYWPTMHNWGSRVIRDVPWIDFQCPLFHRDFIEKIGQFDEDLIFGWGNDVYSGYVCKQNEWKQGIVDWCTIVHLSNTTVKLNQNDPIIKNYNVYAEQGMIKFFQKIGKMEELIELRTQAKHYKYEG
jgi:GT2 family glycosyltransferase